MVRLNGAVLYYLMRYVIRFDIPRWLDELERERVEARRSGFYGHAIQKYYEQMAEIIDRIYGSFWHFVPYQLFGTSAANRAEAFDVLHAHFSRLLGLRSGRRALELGCGLGRLGAWLAAHSGADVTGITLGENEVREANRGGPCNHRVVLGDYHDLGEFGEGAIDAAFAVYCLKYSTELERVFEEVQRVLRPGGLFLSYDIWLGESYDGADDEHRRLHENICESTCMPPLQRASDVVRKAEKAGLRLVYDVDHATEENSWYRQFQDDHIVDYLESRLVASLVRLAGAFKPGLPEIYERYIVHPATDFVKAGELGILDASRTLLFEKACE